MLISNLSTDRLFVEITHHPPLIMFAVSQTMHGDKDTVANVRSNRGFTVNIISEPWAEAANFCSVDAPAEMSEWIGSGLRMESSVRFPIFSSNSHSKRSLDTGRTSVGTGERVCNGV